MGHSLAESDRMTWMASPKHPELSDWITKPDELAELRAQGWQEIPPKWIRVKSTGVVHLVTHPEHQKRLLADGGKEVDGPEGETLHASDLPTMTQADMESEIQRRVDEALQKALRSLGLVPGAPIAQESSDPDESDKGLLDIYHQTPKVSGKRK